jgi:DTW domain-containing protein YfiP
MARVRCCTECRKPVAECICEDVQDGSDGEDAA